MSSDEDSGIGFSPLKRNKVRVTTINSDSESEPTPGCSNWQDEPKTYSREVIKQTPYRRLRFHESDTDSGEEEGQEPTYSVKRKPRRSSRLRNAAHETEDKSSEDEDKEARRSQRNRISAEKEKRFRSLERLSAKRAGKKISDESDDDDERSEYAGNRDTPTIHDDSSEVSSSEEETDRGYRVVAEPFVSKYPGFCRLPSCSNRFVVDVTKIIGVYFDFDLSQEKPAWICAKHEYEEALDKNDILDDLERTKSDEEFIDDPDDGDIEDDNSHSETLDEITKSLRKETPKDIKNAKKYRSQLRKYQLEVHTWKNKSLYTSPEARYRRNMRSARFDVGMKDGSERYDSELEDKLLRTSKKKRKKKKH